MTNRYGYWTFISFLLVIMIISVTSIEVLSGRHQASLIQTQQQKATERLSSFRYKLEAKILSDIFIAKSLAILTSVNTSTIQENWHDVASDIMAHTSDIRSLALAPNDIILYVFPYEKNSTAIGTDFRNVPDQWNTVNKARKIKNVYLAGPVNLVQGGVGLIVRYPVFLDPPENKIYWGVISVVLDTDKLLAESGLQSLQQEYQVAIRGKDSKGPDGEVFLGEVGTFINSLTQESVYFPYGSWVVALSAKPESVTWTSWLTQNSVRLVGYPILLIFMLVISIIYYLYKTAHRTSLYDELTQLPNRRYFMQTLDKVFTKNRASKGIAKKSFALINVDLNDFKTINDQYGHHIGDIVLEQSAREIVRSVKANDFVSRIGGDEFLILLLNVKTQQEVLDEIESIRSHLCNKVIETEDLSIKISASIGFSLYKSKFADYEEMILQADARMYDEKKKRCC